MPTLGDSFPALQDALIERYGRPAVQTPEAPFLAVAAAVLAGDASPDKIASARTALADADWLEPRTLADSDAVSVAEALQETGLPLPRKAIGILQRLARWLVARYEGDEASLAQWATESLREQLAAINGIGQATADALLLHALHRPVYPLDRATYRVFVRHGWLEPTTDYEEARAIVERPLADDPEGLARFSHFMERVGRDACRVSAPRCERCPLRLWLPESGPIDPSA